MPPNPTREDPDLELELKRLQTVRASFEMLKGYVDVIAASVEGTVENFTAVHGYAKRLEAAVETAKKEGDDEKTKGKEEVKGRV
ncbi:hypothetical protein FGG08_001615 [Glutinoglossum americanum]|uniref:Uncharacterized protein n=1 Tax=Glutinoglossum americanum TaxID=1670608 RepID=A0A9P8IAS6_9PEZI|nr:hypothetical protein FGG08_001615 [Glutinoglossum americanum]